jgi:hypothetical protein
MTQPQDPQQSEYVYDPDVLFPSFYTSTAVQLLASHSRWSVSGRLGDDPEATTKAPIDMRALMDNGRIRGAWEISGNCLVTLDELKTFLPNAANSEGVLPVSPAWDELYASLAELAVETPTVELDISAEKPEIPREEQILDLMTRQPPKRDLASFHGDYTRWEFSILGVLYNRLAAILVAVKDVVDHPYDEGEQAWLVYLAARRSPRPVTNTRSTATACRCS